MPEANKETLRTSYPTHDVFSLVDHATGTKWINIGVAFTNRDSSLNIVLDVLPMPGSRVNVRKKEPRYKNPPLAEEQTVSCEESVFF
tara:strand:+ start:211 stop:471 length:261 start_codon:yes stop_codon:yes gene_type:complete